MTILDEIIAAEEALNEARTVSGNAAAYRKIKAGQHFEAILDYVENQGGIAQLYGYKKAKCLSLTDLALNMFHGAAAYVTQYRPRIQKLKDLLEASLLKDILMRRRDYSQKFKIAVIRRQGFAADNYEIRGNPYPMNAANQTIIENEVPDYEEMMMDEDVVVNPSALDITVREVNLGPIVARVATEVIEQLAVSDVE